MNIFSAMMIAKKESYKSNHPIHKLGAIVVYGGSVISKGHNQLRHSAIGKRFAPFEGTIHAERDCLRRVNKDVLKGSTIYVYRETKDGFPAIALPCPDCFKLIEAMGIKKIVFSKETFPFYSIIKL